MNPDWNLKGDWFNDWVDRLGNMEFIDDQRWDGPNESFKRGYFTTDTVKGVVIILE